MLLIEAVLETYGLDDFALWPVAPSPASRALPLSGRLSAPEVGTAMAVLTTATLDLTEAGNDPCSRLRELVAAECVLAPGGLRARDTATGVTVPPGCCCGLEDWREWEELARGGPVRLGHDPTPRAEFTGTALRLFPDEAAPRPVEIPLSALPELLRGVRESLAGFLRLVGPWAASHDPSLAPALTAKLDRELAVSTTGPPAAQ